MTIRLRQARDADVIVAGAGPAGAAVALELARSGVDVLLVDHARFPRDKVCGDFVGPAALQALERLGLGGELRYRSANVIRQAALFLDGRHLLTSAFPAVAGLPAYGRALPRLALDDIVVRAATGVGARLITATLTGYDVDQESVRVHLKHDRGTSVVTAHALVGADGSSSTVAAIARGARGARADRIIAVRGYYEDVPGPSDRADLYFTGASFPGYSWVFPTSATSANVGIGMVLETIPPVDEHLRATLLDLIRTDAALRERLAGARLAGRIVGWPLATYNPRLAVTAERVVLVGDAAGLINPLNGEGIQYALQSASWAAETIQSCLRSGDLSRAALAPYAQRVARELRYDMALARLIVRAISNRTLNPIWLRVLRAITARARHDPDYAHVTGAVLAGLTPARAVLSRRVIRGTVEEGSVGLAVDLLAELLRGPGHVRGTATASARMIGGIASGNLRDPIATLRWGLDVGLAGADLLEQVARSFLSAPAGQSSRSTM